MSVKRFFANEEVRWNNIHWQNTLGLALIHTGAVIAVPYLFMNGLRKETFLLTLAYWFITSFSVTGGMHRGFTHNAFRRTRIFEAFVLFFSAGVFEGPVLTWAAVHRRHHSEDGRERDPHNINKGFWWAHIGWVIFGKQRPTEGSSIDDLTSNPLVMLQSKYYVPLAFFSGLGLPAGLAWYLWGDFWGGLLVGGFLRILIQLHATFCVNSSAHVHGTRPFTRASTAVQNFFVALISLGEGWHNFHHAFKKDYRNGVFWWQLDVTKHLLFGLSQIGVISELHETPRAAIERKMREVRYEDAHHH